MDDKNSIRYANLTQIRSFIARNKKRLLAYPNVRYIAAARKISGGVPSKSYTLTFYVSAKKQRINRKDRIPYRFMDDRSGRAIPTDVVESSKTAEAFGFRSGHMIVSHDDEEGTIFATSTVGSTKYIITNAHVLLDVDKPDVLGDVIGVNSNGDEAVIGVGKAAIPLSSTRVNRIDAGLVEVRPPSPDFDIENLMVSGSDLPVLGFDYFRTATPARYFYNVGTSVFECRLPNRIETEVPVIVEGTEVQFSHFWHLEMVTAGNRPGHSGAMVYRHVAGGLLACGILFAGVRDAFIYCYSAQKTINALRPYF